MIEMTRGNAYSMRSFLTFPELSTVHLDVMVKRRGTVELMERRQLTGAAVVG